MSRERSESTARSAALETLTAAVERLGERGGTAVVRGEQGSGKTTLLAAARRQWTARGILVIMVPSAEGAAGAGRDVRAVLAAVQGGVSPFVHSRLMAAAAAVGERCSPTAGEPALVAELCRLFACLRQDRRVVLMVDDLHLEPEPLPAVIAARRAGVVVVASQVAGGPRRGLLPMIETADCRVDLDALPAAEVDLLITRAVGMPVDSAVPAALHTALGPFAGNPGTMLATVRELRRRERLVELGGVCHLRGRTAPIALPGEHFLVNRARALGRLACELVVLVGTSQSFVIDDLAGFAAGAGCGVAECGRMADRLVAAGALAADTTGRLCCPCPALVVALRSLIGDDAVRRLHRVFAEYLLRGERSLGLDPAVLADHVVLAGATLARDHAVVSQMIAGDWFSTVRPERIARRYHAALLHAEPDDPATGRILSSLLGLLRRIGWFDRLGEVVADVAPTYVRTHRAELAVSAALAALHAGRPVPAGLRELLAGTSDGDPALELSDKWFAGQRGVRAADVAAAFTPFDHRELAGQPAEDALAACVPFDLMAMFEVLLGAGYRAPQSGPLVAYHRVVTAYATGRWDEALSAAADLDLVCGPDTPARHSSRLVVAEIHAQRGQREQAEASLARVPAVDGLVAARGWAEMGLLAGAGDYEAAFSAGARAYALVSADDTDPVVLPLLLRLLATASAARLADQARWLLAEVQARQRMCDRDPSWRLLLLLARGVAERDAEAALAAVDAARTCGQRLGLLEACLAATSVVAEPKPLLCEAYEVATELRAEPLRAAVRARMKSFRVAPPRSRSLAGLSDTQTRIIELIRAGKTNRQIAAELGVSEKTVERHLTRLFGKTGCRSRVELATTTAADQVLAIGA